MENIVFTGEDYRMMMLNITNKPIGKQKRAGVRRNMTYSRNRKEWGLRAAARGRAAPQNETIYFGAFFRYNGNTYKKGDCRFCLQ